MYHTKEVIFSRSRKRLFFWSNYAIRESPQFKIAFYHQFTKSFKQVQTDQSYFSQATLNWERYGHGRRRGGLSPPWILKLLAKKVVFSISRGKNQISPLLAPPGKILGKSSTAPPGKNPSDAHGYGCPKRSFICTIVVWKLYAQVVVPKPFVTADRPILDNLTAAREYSCHSVSMGRTDQSPAQKASGVTTSIHFVLSRPGD